MIAVRQRNYNIVEFICENCKGHIEIDYECSRNGLTALARACLLNEFDIATCLLVKVLANKDYVNKKDGKSILDIAIKAKNS